MGAANAEQQQMARKHVFAVNASREFLDFLRELLQDEGYNVTTTNFAPHTFDQIAALRPDLIVLDVATGREAGWDLLEHLQREAITNQIPIIITSTDQRSLDRTQGDQARYGSQYYLVKPFDVGALMEAIRSLTGGAKPGAQG